MNSTSPTSLSRLGQEIDTASPGPTEADKAQEREIGNWLRAYGRSAWADTIASLTKRAEDAERSRDLWEREAHAQNAALCRRAADAVREVAVMQRRAESAEASNALLREALDQAYFALATDGEDDAGYNLQGALDDLICKAANGVTQRTIERVLKQIIVAQDVLTQARAALASLDKSEPSNG